MVSESESVNIVDASSNVTPCFSQLPVAFASSHSNIKLIASNYSEISPEHGARLTRPRAVMQSGKLVEVATSSELFANPQQEYTRELLSAVPIPDPARARRRPA